MKLYYDSDCGICSAFVIRITGHYKRKSLPLTAIPYSAICDKDGAHGVDLTYADFGVQLVDSDFKVFKGPDAIITLLSQISYLSFFKRLMHVPGFKWIFAIGYQAVASNRRSLSKLLGLGICRLP